MFAQAKAQNRAAFLPYFPIGYPTYAESLDAIAAMAGGRRGRLRDRHPLQRSAGGRSR